MFGGYTAHLYAVGIVGTYGHSNDNAASSTTVGAIVPLKRGRWGTYFDQALYRPCSLIGTCTTLYCATPLYTIVGADAARFLHGWLRDPLLCYPPLHYCWGRCCPFFFNTVGGAILYCATPPYTTVGADAARFLLLRLAARSSTMLHPPTLLLEQMLPVVLRLAARFSTVLPPPTLL